MSFVSDLLCNVMKNSQCRINAESRRPAYLLALHKSSLQSPNCLISFSDTLEWKGHVVGFNTKYCFFMLYDHF